MKSYALISVVTLTLSLFMYTLPAKGTIPNPPGPHELQVATLNLPYTVDPALAYEPASGELILNVYETLIDFRGSSTTEFMPELASSWSISPNGQTYTFQIRTAVHWQDAAYGSLTPQDVEYSLERVLVRDYTGGPAWLLYDAIFGTYGPNLADPVAQGQAIDAAVTSDAASVTIQLATGLPYPPFLSILAQYWSSIICKAWATAHGDWPGTGLQDGSWVNWIDPPTSPLDQPTPIMMGTGPYKLDYLDYASQSWSIVKFDDYWGGWGNPRRGFAARGYLTRITEVQYYPVKDVTPPFDSFPIPRENIASVWQQPGIRCIYPLLSPSLDVMFFNYNTSTPSPWIGNGQWGELGIIPTFFSDVHVRKAVAYSFNWTKYLMEAYMAEGRQNAIPVPSSFKFFNQTLPKYSIDVTKAIEEWQLAWGGQVWTSGFRFTILYNTGSTTRQKWSEMIKASLETQNPKFHVDLIGIFPPYNFDPSLMPIFNLGWYADYPDVHTFLEAFLQSDGYLGPIQHISLDPFSGEMDDLIEWGLHNATDAERKVNYDQLWQLYIQQVPSVPLIQPYGRHWERDWVQGWYYNSMLPGSNFYSMWKEELPWEDVNSDGKVDIKDLAAVAKAYPGAIWIAIFPPYPPDPEPWWSPNWNSRLDINIVNPATGARGDMKIDIRDLAAVAKLYGYTAPEWQPPP